MTPHLRVLPPAILCVCARVCSEREKRRPITRLKLVLLRNQPLTPLDPSAVIPQKKRMRERERKGEKSHNRQSEINEENVGEL